MISQQQRLIYLPVVGMILLCVLAGAYLAAWKRFSKSKPPVKVVKHPVETPADDVLKYWTADKMRNAKAVPMPNVSAPDRGKRHPRRPPHAPRPQDA